MYSGGMAEKETGFGVITIGDPAVHSWFRLREKLARQLSGLWWKIFWQCAKVSAAAGHTCRSLPKVERRAPAVEAFSFFCSVLRASQPLARSHYTRAPVLFTGWEVRPLNPGHFYHPLKGSAGFCCIIIVGSETYQITMDRWQTDVLQNGPSYRRAIRGH